MTKYLFNKIDIQKSREPTLQELHNLSQPAHAAKVKASMEHFYGFFEK